MTHLMTTLMWSLNGSFLLKADKNSVDENFVDKIKK